MTNYNITINKDFNSIEISFDSKPSQEVRDALKALKFRWHGVKKVWYGYCTEDQARAAIDGKPNTKDTSKATSTEKVNKYGVKVGDIFCMSWGYEQTNVNFFQVVALAGETSVRVREIRPHMSDEKPTCSMAADRTYKIGKELLPPSSSSVFIKDQEKGDLKRVQCYTKDGTNPLINVGHDMAYLCTEDKVTVYESWYY